MASVAGPLSISSPTMAMAGRGKSPSRSISSDGSHSVIEIDDSDSECDMDMHDDHDNVMGMGMNGDLLMQNMNDVSDHQHRSGSVMPTASANNTSPGNDALRSAPLIDSVDSSSCGTSSSLLLHKNSNLNIQQLFCPRTNQLVDTKTALEGKTVLYYFSAAWCKPCKQFTPLLIDWYNRMQQQQQYGASASTTNIQVVFVSADHMKFNFDEYTQQMPWLCVPFKDAFYKRDELMSLFKVEGIPQVIVVSPDSEALNWDATAAIVEDPAGRYFPWRRQGLEDLLQGQHFVMPVPQPLSTPSTNATAPNTNLPLDFFCANSYDAYSNTNLAPKYLILYFCASWCDACVDFTPLLCDTFKTIKAQRSDVEMIHVSLDQRKAEYDKFVSHLPCPSIDFDQVVCRSKITAFYNIKTIPTVLILGPVPTQGSDRDRPVINANARQQIASTYLENLKRSNSGSGKMHLQPQLGHPCNVRHIANLIPPAAVSRHLQSQPLQM